MHLSDYLSQNGLTATAFGLRIGRHKSTITRLIKRQMRPDLATMDRILKETDGAVTPNDFFDITAPSEAHPEGEAA